MPVAVVVVFAVVVVIIVLIWASEIKEYAYGLKLPTLHNLMVTRNIPANGNDPLKTVYS